jgi:hypothetical protein
MVVFSKEQARADTIFHYLLSECAFLVPVRSLGTDKGRDKGIRTVTGNSSR